MEVSWQSTGMDIRTHDRCHCKPRDLAEHRGSGQTGSVQQADADQPGIAGPGIWKYGMRVNRWITHNVSDCTQFGQCGCWCQEQIVNCFSWTAHCYDCVIYSGVIE